VSLKNYRPPWLTYDELRAEAECILGKHHPAGTLPIPIEAIVEFGLSMDVIPMEGMKEGIGVDAFLTNDLEYIYVDQYVLQHAPGRYRFSLAHEVAHYWLHDELYQNCSIQSLADWVAVQDEIGPEEYRWFEWQANNLAGLLLVPTEPLKAAFHGVLARLGAAGVATHRVDHHPTRAYVIRELAGTFEVSEVTMEIRLEKDGLLARP
jgi:Zn-dependent peptidase ImmA (M78 family)